MKRGQIRSLVLAGWMGTMAGSGLVQPLAARASARAIATTDFTPARAGELQSALADLESAVRGAYTPAFGTPAPAIDAPARAVANMNAGLPTATTESLEAPIPNAQQPYDQRAMSLVTLHESEETELQQVDAAEEAALQGAPRSERPVISPRYLRERQAIRWRRAQERRVVLQQNPNAWKVVLRENATARLEEAKSALGRGDYDRFADAVASVFVLLFRSEANEADQNRIWTTRRGEVYHQVQSAGALLASMRQNLPAPGAPVTEDASTPELSGARAAGTEGGMTGRGGA